MIVDEEFLKLVCGNHILSFASIVDFLNRGSFKLFGDDGMQLVEVTPSSNDRRIPYDMKFNFTDVDGKPSIIPLIALFNKVLLHNLNSVVIRFVEPMLSKDADGSIIWAVEYGTEYYTHAFSNISFSSLKSSDSTNSVICHTIDNSDPMSWINDAREVIYAVSTKQMINNDSCYLDVSRFYGNNCANFLDHNVATCCFRSQVKGNLNTNTSETNYPLLESGRQKGKPKSGSMVPSIGQKATFSRDNKLAPIARTRMRNTSHGATPKEFKR